MIRSTKPARVSFAASFEVHEPFAPVLPRYRHEHEHANPNRNSNPNPNPTSRGVAAMVEAPLSARRATNGPSPTDVEKRSQSLRNPIGGAGAFVAGDADTGGTWRDETRLLVFAFGGGAGVHASTGREFFFFRVDPGVGGWVGWRRCWAGFFYGFLRIPTKRTRFRQRRLC